MRRRWLAPALAILLLGAAACAGGTADGDLLAGDLPIRLDAGGDPGPRDPGAGDGSPADASPGDPGDPGSPGDSGDPGTATDPGDPDAAADAPAPADVPSDPGLPADPGATPDAGPEDTFVPCFLGQSECFGGLAGENGKTCATAIGVSRWVASTGGVLANPSNEETDNNDDLPTSAGTRCKDSGNDLYYRVYLKAGETFSLLLAYHPSIDMMAKIYRGTDCADASLMKCLDDNVDGPTVGSDPPVDTDAEMDSFVADAEGWYTIVFDGRTSDDMGRHMVRFNLFNCGDVDCCCY